MSSLILSIFEYAASVFEGFLLVSFTFDYCGWKKEKSLPILWMCRIIFAAAIILLSTITFFEGIGILLFAFILFIMALLFLDGTLIQKAFASVFPILCTTVIAALTMPITAAIFHMPLADIYSTLSVQRAIGVFITKVALYIIYKAVITPKKDHKDILLTASEWIQVVAVSLLSVLMMSCAVELQLSDPEALMKKDILIVIVGVSCFDLYCFYTVLKTNRYNRIKRENDLFRLREKFSIQYAENVKAQYEETKALRHDFKHSLSALGILLERGQTQEAKELIQKHLTLADASNTYINTENELLNAIINSKLSTASQHGIKTSVAISSSCAEIDGIDLCNLLGNLLDNAIEACANDDIANPEIRCKIYSDRSKISILVQNTVCGSVLDKNPSLISAKDDKIAHGYGLKTVRSIVDKYNGLTDIYEEQGMFCVLTTMFI